MELILLIGLQGSGKTTFYKNRFSDTHVHISKDLMRGKKNREQRQQRQIEAAFQEGRSVVVDNTNPTAAIRMTLIQLACNYGVQTIGYFFESNIQQCLIRNRSRHGHARVPDVAIYTTAKQLEPPRMAEGFKKIYLVRMI